jgi:hypothetical protein
MKICNACKNNITKKDRSHMKCEGCHLYIHKKCARERKLIAHDGAYYCEKHDPTNLEGRTRSQKGIERARLKEQLSQMITTLIESSLDYDSNRHSTSDNTRNDEISEVSDEDDIEIVDESCENEFPTNIDELKRYAENLPSNSNKNPPARKSQNDIPPHSMGKICQTCSKMIDGIYFSCTRCKKYFHENCVNINEHMNQIEGKWGCGKCLIEWAQLVSIHAYKSGKTDIQNTRYQKTSERQVESSKEINITEILKAFQEQQIKMMENMFSNFALMLTNKQEKTKDELENEEVSNNLRRSNEIRTKVRRSELERLRLSDSTEYDFDKLLEEEPDLIRGRKSEEKQDNLKNAHEDALNKLAETQIAENKKNAYRTLPKVKNVNFEWKVFYKTFLETKILFSPQENVSMKRKNIFYTFSTQK